MSLFNRKAKEKKAAKKTTRDYKDKLLSSNTPFAAAEAFKTLRTNLMFTAGKSVPVFGIVSCFPDTGKSLISSNTAIAFAMSDKKVLLIDADMRKPVQHKCFQIKNERGLSQLLSHQITIEEAIQKAQNEDGVSFDIMTAGPIPPNPQELLSSKDTVEVFEELKKRYDVIVIDLPPAGVVSDAVTLKDIVTGFVFIVRAGMSTAPSVKSTVENMIAMGCKMVGTVLNFVDLKSGSYSSNYYGKKYYYYYSGYKD